MYNLVKQGEATYLLPQQGGMKVPGLIIATEELLNQPEMDKPLEQVCNVAYLPGIVGYSIAMPDIHWGYGFPIGGVAATDIETGVISPGGVGYDINCGVRLALAPEKFSNLTDNQKKELLKALFHLIPSGVGRGNKSGHLLTEGDYRQLVNLGAKWSIQKGFGFELDLEHMESYGVLAGGDISAVSSQAKARGASQLGTIGSGNHFVEIGEVEHLYLPEIAKAWGVEKGQIYILIHSGSRGFGHQICQDTLNQFVKLGYAKGLPDKQLVAAPIQSEAGKQYFSAMNCAANFAFNNRQQILHRVREGFRQILHMDPEEIRLLYDVCHNIAKFEEHEVNGVRRKLCVHRKGATRALGKNAVELAPIFKQTGQPVLVPGDMGRASHLMVGLGNPLTFCTACHGAGRAKSRVQSMKNWRGQDPVEYMKNSRGVLVMAESIGTIAEEMPDAYKEVDTVVEAVQKAGLANMVAKLRPRLVIKG